MLICCLEPCLANRCVGSCYNLGSADHFVCCSWNTWSAVPCMDWWWIPYQLPHLWADVGFPDQLPHLWTDAGFSDHLTPVRTVAEISGIWSMCFCSWGFMIRWPTCLLLLGVVISWSILGCCCDYQQIHACTAVVILDQLIHHGLLWWLLISFIHAWTASGNPDRLIHEWTAGESSDQLIHVGTAASEPLSADPCVDCCWES